MRKLWSTLKAVLASGEDAVLVTVVASSGSVPRGAGAHMIVDASGRLAGTIGGGAVEYEAINRAKKALADGISCSRFYRLHENAAADLGMICGGSVSVFFRLLKAKDRQIIRLLDEIDSRYEKNEPTWLLMDITEGEAGVISVCSDLSDALHIAATPEKKKEIIPEAKKAATPETHNAAISGEDDSVTLETKNRPGNKPEIIEADGRSYYLEKIVYGGIVYIFGGGHVAQQLARVLTYVSFRCVVVEDREEFAGADLFGPGVETMLVDNLNDCSVFENITADDYICIMTRGHQNDYEVQSQALKTRAGYIGVIGSRRKIAASNVRLLEDGYTQTDIDRLVRPIGLAIKAETPEEIAISIAAQLIEKRAVRNGSTK